MNRVLKTNEIVTVDLGIGKCQRSFLCFDKALINDARFGISA